MIPLPSDDDPLADAPLSPEQREVWLDLRAELTAAKARIQELESRLKVLAKQTEAAEDPGQAILNRPDFNREVARMLAFDERYGTLSSVLYFDIDNLDAVRERHGSAVVDAAVRCACDALLLGVRRSDIVGRLASDEFGVLLPRCDNPEAWKKGEQLASALYDALEKLWGPNLTPSVSYGAYSFGGKEDVGTGLKKAAEGLTQIKR